ncbi:hypothetical protein HZC53_00630 [Candidatus Uhrbacteria bacterium]|nr:hypothetical protein [Candidatus Uhrbacteria bacterium]
MGEPTLFIYRDADDPLPKDPDCVILGRNGAFRHTATGLFSRFEKADEIPTLAEQAMEAVYLLPPLPAAMTQQVLNFFREVYRRYHSEAIVLLAYNQATQEFAIVAPKQDVSAGHCKYEPNTAVPNGFMLVGTIHSHGSFGAHHSGTDVHDEESFDGVHVTYGDVGSELISVVASLAVSGCRFQLEPERVLGGLRFVKTEEPETGKDTEPAKREPRTGIAFGIWQTILEGFGIWKPQIEAKSRILNYASSGYAVDLPEEDAKRAEPDEEWYKLVTDGRPAMVYHSTIYGYPGYLNRDYIDDDDLGIRIPGHMQPQPGRKTKRTAIRRTMDLAAPPDTTPQFESDGYGGLFPDDCMERFVVARRSLGETGSVEAEKMRNPATLKPLTGGPETGKEKAEPLTPANKATEED